MRPPKTTQFIKCQNLSGSWEPFTQSIEGSMLKFNLEELQWSVVQIERNEIEWDIEGKDGAIRLIPELVQANSKWCMLCDQ